MRSSPFRNILGKALAVVVVPALMALMISSLIHAARTGEIQGRYGQVYRLPDSPLGFWMYVAVFSVSAVVMAGLTLGGVLALIETYRERRGGAWKGRS